MEEYDTGTARRQWDFGAEAFDRFQREGRDFYRYEFFGPAQVAMCGDVARLKLLDLGCGSGYFSREMAKRGARVTGIDLSERQVELAKRHEAESPFGIRYLAVDAEEAAAHFGPSSFDMVTSCVALQDVPHPERALAGAFQVLRPGGRLVFSITHPCTDMPVHEWDSPVPSERRGLKVGRYFEGARIDFAWRGPKFAYEFTTSLTHRTLSWWANTVIGAGFALLRLEEPRPSEDAVERRPELHDATIVPYFLFVDARRPG